ncbi:MAG: dihydrofolate reductase, partial [Actinomycetota bacterium]|nr:dihydrofolate reductase [Actinomycetota bacterium]
MAKTIYYLASSLDGFLARPDGDLDWLIGFVGSERPGVDATPQESYAELMAGTGVLISGSGTYQWVMDREADWPYDVPTYLFTTRDLEIPEGRDVRIVGG